MNKKTLRRLKEWVDTKIDLPSNHSFFRDQPYQQWKAWSRYKIHNQKDPNLIPLTNGERRAVWHEALFFRAVWNGDYKQAKDELIESLALPAFRSGLNSVFLTLTSKYTIVDVDVDYSRQLRVL